MEIDNKKSKFIQVIESLSNLIKNETVIDEIDGEDINQGLIDAFFIKSSEILAELKTLVSDNLKTIKIIPTASNMVDRCHQKEADYSRMDRSLPLGRIMCQFMTHVVQEFQKDQSFWKNLDLNLNFALPLIQQNGDYFVGFCKHRQETHNDTKYKKIGRAHV